MSLVIGSIAFDTIKNVYGRRERIVGGSSIYYAYAASLFENPKIVGVVGEDFPETIIKEMSEKGIDTEGIIKDKGKTFFWEGEYSDDFSERKTITTELNVFETFDPIIPESFKNEKNVFLANIAPELQKKVIKRLEEKRYFVMDTMNLWINIAKKELIETIEKVQGIIINDEEAKMLTGEHYLFNAAKKIKKMGPDFVLIKKGEHGSMLFVENRFFILPPYPKETVIDPTGAGDSYAGAFMGYLENVKRTDILSLKKAMVYGTIVSSFTIEDFGIERLRTLTKDDVENRLKEYKEMINF